MSEEKLKGKKELTDDEVFAFGRFPDESYQEYKERRKEAKNIRNRRMNGGKIASNPAPTRKQRRKEGAMGAGGNTPFVRTGKNKLKKSEKKQYKKNRQKYLKDNKGIG